MTPAPDEQTANSDPYSVPSVRLVPMIAPGLEAPESLLGARLKYARDELDLNVEGLARLVKEFDSQGQGISSTSISRYEAGSSLPGIREFRLLCDALDVPAQWLLYGQIAPDGDAQEQALIKALRDYMRAQKDDETLSGGQAQQNWFSSQARKDRIARAKKP